MESSEELIDGDYVLATKWNDGDSRDHWFVGYFIKKEGDRYFVGDKDGNLARFNGFRKCKKIHPAIGAYLVKNTLAISSIKINLWEYVNSSIHDVAIEIWEDEHSEVKDD